MDALRADCGNCFGLCCVVPAFVRSSDFAITKPAQVPCPNLQDDFGCGIHTQLRERGFSGCTVYDCFGAGQQVSQVTFAGQDWRTTPSPMFAVFPIMRQVHELLWYLREARARAGAGLQPQLASAWGEVEQLTQAGPDDLLNLDTDELRRRVAPLLRAASADARTAGAVRPGHRPADHANAMLLGADLREADLRRADLRGAVLVGARLARADLREADLIGADLRGADLAGADLTDAWFLTQSQLDAARGTAQTRLPDGRHHPRHWR